MKSASLSRHNFTKCNGHNEMYRCDHHKYISSQVHFYNVKCKFPRHYAITDTTGVFYHSQLNAAMQVMPRVELTCYKCHTFGNCIENVLHYPKCDTPNDTISTLYHSS